MALESDWATLIALQHTPMPVARVRRVAGVHLPPYSTCATCFLVLRVWWQFVAACGYGLWYSVAEHRRCNGYVTAARLNYHLNTLA